MSNESTGLQALDQGYRVFLSYNYLDFCLVIIGSLFS